MTQESVISTEVRQWVGRESEPVTLEVERGAIRKFAEAIGDSNPLFNDEAAARRTRYGGMIAPPTFLRSVPLPKLPLPEMPNLRRILDGGSDWEYFQPVWPDDRITAVTRLENVRERRSRLGPMLFTTLKTTYTNQFGQVAATQTSTLIFY
ncbi:MAG: MaoC family dehydratase N-terminal domain-containing protein [Chloroflexi bacterium]|nr:MaoC family dehydratase N-terminal domain-containing protein [Chloroflexota bacterium]